MPFLEADETRTAGAIEPGEDREEADVLARGTTVHRYVVLDELGRGGMGVVYKAYDPELDRQIALKILRSKSHGPDSAISKRLHREAQALAQLQHPNVIAVYDVGLFQDDVFLAMELVKGSSLRNWMKENSPNRQQIVDVFIQAGTGLSAAHAAGLIHRDFKPDNVMVGDDGRVRVLDFGLARAAESDSDATDDDEDRDFARAEITKRNLKASLAAGELQVHTRTEGDFISLEHSGVSLLRAPITRNRGLFQGTPAYMAPEQFAAADVSARSDQYSFCTALFEALCGFRPVQATSLEELRDKVLAGKQVAIPSDSNVPRHIQRMLRRGLSVGADERYPSMDELLRELQKDPAARIRQIAILGGLALVIAVITFVVARNQTQEPESPCRRAAEKLDTVWNQAAKQRMQQGFLASSRSHASESFERTRAVLDIYASNWSLMRVETCRATKVRGEQSERLLDLRMQCLDRRLARMDALIDVLSDEPTVETIDDAVTAAYHLPTLDLCADADALTAIMPPPEDEAKRERLGKLSHQLRRAEAFESAGRYAEGLESVKQIIADARELSHPPFTAESLYLAGKLLDKMGSQDEAQARLLEAAKLASRVGDVTLGADAWLELLRVVGHIQGNFDSAVWLGHTAESAIAAAGDKKLLRARLLTEMGGVAFADGKYDEANQRHQEALQIRQQELGKSHPDVAISLQNLGANFYHQGRAAEAIAPFEQALGIMNKAFGPQHPRTGQLHLNLGGTLVSQKQYEKALVHNRKALEISEAVSKTSQQTGTILNNLGEFFWLQRQPEKALEHYARAAAIFEKVHGNDHPFTAYPLTGMGQALVALERPQEAQEPLQRAYDIRKNAKSPGDLALVQFYRQRASWALGQRDARVMADARTAYETYRQAPQSLEAEVTLMEEWLRSQAKSP